jgi:hypothetical protein
MSCDDVCRIVSDRDRRALRSRRVRAHIRGCSECAAFASAVPARTADLRALAAPLPPAVAASILSQATGGAGSAGGGCGAAVSGLGTKVALSAAGAKIAAGVAVVSATLGAAAVVGADRPAPRAGATSLPARTSVSFGARPASGHASAAPALLPLYGAGRAGVPAAGGAAGRGHIGKAAANRSGAGTHGRVPAHTGAFSGAPRGTAYGVGHTGHGVGNGSAAPGQWRSQAAANRGNGGQPGGNPHSASVPGRSGSARGQSGSAPGRFSSPPGQGASAPGRSSSPPGQGASAPGLVGASPRLAATPRGGAISAPTSPAGTAVTSVTPNSPAGSPRAGSNSVTPGQPRNS